MHLRFLALAACIGGFVGVVPSQVLAHSGGLDANGCHGGSRPYHCHRGGGSTTYGATSGFVDDGGYGSTTRERSRTGRTGGDLDCADFSSWRGAQDAFLNSGSGDPHRLDADNDGIACEHLR
jgi:Excalibur calcium-binding domain